MIKKKTFVPKMAMLLMAYAMVVPFNIGSHLLIGEPQLPKKINN